MLELNSFQKKCEEELSTQTELLGFKITDRYIYEGYVPQLGGEQIYIEAKIDDLKIWIYDDGADIKSQYGSKQFEAPDYDTGDELIKAFVNKVVYFLSKRRDTKQ